MLTTIDFFDGQMVDHVVSINNINYLEMSNMIIDEIDIRNEIPTSIDTNKKDWDYTSILLCKFQNDLSGGNVNLYNMNVEYLRIKRRKKTEFEWQVLKDVSYVNGKVDYEFYDKYIENGEIYEYCIVPVLGGNAEGNGTNIEEIATEFYGLYLTSKDEDFAFIFDLEYGTINNNIKTNVIETIGSKYPYVISNGNVNYKSGSVNTTLISDTSLYGQQIDNVTQKTLRIKVEEFLLNKKPKLFRSSANDIMIVKIIGQPKIEIDKLNNSVYHISFDYVEIGDGTDLDEMRTYGLI